MSYSELGLKLEEHFGSLYIDFVIHAAICLNYSVRFSFSLNHDESDVTDASNKLMHTVYVQYLFPCVCNCCHWLW